MASPYVWVYDDPARGALLLRGTPAQQVLQAAHLDGLARWSHGGHGWVISRVHLPDILAAGDHVGVRCRVKEVTG